MEWRSARDGLRLFVIANVVRAIAATAGSVLGLVNRSSSVLALQLPVGILSGASAVVEVVAVIGLARLPRGAPGKGVAAGWLAATIVAYAVWVAGPVVAELPELRRVVPIAGTVVFTVEAALFLVTAASITRSWRALFALTAVAIAARMATLVVFWAVEARDPWRTTGVIATLLVVTVLRLAWAAAIAKAIPPRADDRLELADKMADVARHTLALFRKGFVLRVAGTYAIGFAIILAIAFGGDRAASVLGVIFTLVMLVSAAMLLIALGGWAVVGGSFAKAAGWFAAIDFVAALAWIAVAIFDVSLGERAGIVARAATAAVGTAAATAFALSIARLAKTGPLARDAHRVVWTIGGFVLALTATAVVAALPIHVRGDLARVLVELVVRTLPSLAFAASALAAIFMLWLVRAAERAVDASSYARPRIDSRET